MSYRDFSICEFKTPDSQVFDACSTESSVQAACAIAADSPQRSDCCSRTNCCFLVDKRRRGASVHNEPRAVSVQRAFDIEMMIRVQAQRDSCKSAIGQETGEALTHRGARAIWIDVKHLARAIDNHPKFNHFVYAKDAVDVREVPRLCYVRPGSGPARSLLKSERSVIATGTFVTIQLPMAMLFTLLAP
jgi:hypothetical protein